MGGVPKRPPRILTGKRKGTVTAQPSLYEQLGVDSRATANQVRKAFCQLARQHHPDWQGGNLAQFLEVSRAFEILGNEDTRRHYDCSDGDAKAALEASRARRNASELRETLDRWFTLFDVDDNGYVEEHEFLEVMTMVGVPMSQTSMQWQGEVGILG